MKKYYTFADASGNHSHVNFSRHVGEAQGVTHTKFRFLIIEYFIIKRFTLIGQSEHACKLSNDVFFPGSKGFPNSPPLGYANTPNKVHTPFEVRTPINGRPRPGYAPAMATHSRSWRLTFCLGDFIIILYYGLSSRHGELASSPLGLNTRRGDLKMFHSWRICFHHLIYYIRY